MGKIFEIDIRLKESNYLISKLDLCSVYLSKNANFPWFVLIPERSDIIELFDLTDKDQKILIEEINKITKIVKKYFIADKINIATLGNVVPQMHVHVIARYKNDIAWPGPIWNSNIKEIHYEDKVLDKIIKDISKIIREL